MFTLLKKIFWFTIDVVEATSEETKEEKTSLNEELDVQYFGDGNYTSTIVHRDKNGEIIE